MVVEDFKNMNFNKRFKDAQLINNLFKVMFDYRWSSPILLFSDHSTLAIEISFLHSWYFSNLLFIYSFNFS